MAVMRPSPPRTGAKGKVGARLMVTPAAASRANPPEEERESVMIIDRV